MANHQTNFTSNFGEMGETGNAAFVLNVNGTSHTYHPVGSDVSVDVATVRRILATAPNLAQSIASVLAAGGYPILVYDGSEYGYIKTVNSRYVFTCLDSLNGVKQAEVDIQDGTITAGTGGVNGVSILARTDSDLFLKITTAVTLGRMPIISDTGVYYQLIAKTGTIAQFGRITGTGALEVLTVDNSDQITSSSFVFVQDPYYVHTDNNFTNTDKSNVDANTNARHTHTNKSVLDDIEQSNIDNWDNKLNPTGDASDTTSTFTKANGDTSSIASGDKLSAIFTAISSFFASLKALAFKDKASYNDLSSGVQSSLNKADSALQSHQSVTDSNPTLDWGATSTVGTVGGTNLQVTMPSNPASGKQDTVFTDTDSSAFGDNTTIATGFSSNKLHLNIASRLWTYIQGKISSVLGLTSSSYGGNAATAGYANIANGLKTSDIYGTTGWRRYLSIDFSQYADASLYWGYTIVFDLYSDGYKSDRAYLGRLAVEIANWGTLTNKIPSRCLLNWTTKAYINDTTFRPNLVVSQGKIELYIYHSVNYDYYVHIGKIDSIYSWEPSNITIDETPNSQYYSNTDYATYTSGKTIYTAGLASYLVDYANNLTPGGTSGQYLKSNGSGTAPSWANPSDMTVGKAAKVSPFIIDKGAQTTNVWAKVATASVSAWNGYAITLMVGFDGYANANAYAGEIVVRYQVGNGGVYGNRRFYIYRRQYANENTLDAKLIRVGNTLELWVKDGVQDTGLRLVPVYSKGFSVNYGDSGDRSKQLTDSAFTTYIADKTKYDADVRTTAFIPGFSQVGSSSTPVYVDADGQVRPCDSIELAAPKHSATITSGAGVVYYTSPADTFAIAVNYDKANSKAHITVNNTTSGRTIYVSLGHSNNLTPVAYRDNAVIVGTTSEYNLFDLDILCMGIGDQMPVYSFTIGIYVNESKCTYTIYDKMLYHL